MTPYDTIMEWYDRLQVFQRCPEADVFLRCFLEVLKTPRIRGWPPCPTSWPTGRKRAAKKSPHARRHRRRAHHDRPQIQGPRGPVVLLPWTDASLKANDPVLMEEDGLRMVCKNGPHCGRVYYEALLRQATELLNQFYVAFTRAREELYVFRTSAATVRRGCGSHALDVLWQQAGLTVPYQLEGGDDAAPGPAAGCRGRGGRDRHGTGRRNGRCRSRPAPPRAGGSAVCAGRGLAAHAMAAPAQDLPQPAGADAFFPHGIAAPCSMPVWSSCPWAASVRTISGSPCGKSLPPSPLPTGRTALTGKMSPPIWNLACSGCCAIPQFGLWQRRGVPEQSMLEADGPRRELLRADLIVPPVLGDPGGGLQERQGSWTNMSGRYGAICAALEQGGTAVARGLLIYLDRQAFRLVEPGSASELFTDLGAYPRYFCEDEA